MSFRYFFALGLLVALGVWPPSAVSAAVLFPSPPVVTAAPGTTFPVSILLNSEGENINVVEATLTYPTDLLEVIELSRGSSFLSLWAEAPSVDAAQGTVHFVGGRPNGNVVYNAPALTITFYAKGRGEARLTIDPDRSGVYRNDGVGTKTSLATQPATVTLATPDSLTPRPTSPTHPDQSRWYQSRDLIMRWPVAPQLFSSFQLSRDPGAEPDELADETNGQVYYPSLTNGPWYFTLKQRLANDVWSPVARYRVMVDATPPEPFDVTVAQDQTSGQQLLVFGPTDATSGIARTEVQLVRQRSRWLPFVTTEDWRTAEHFLALGYAPFTGKAVVRAFDLAGNVREATYVAPGFTERRWQVLVLPAAAIVVLFVLEMIILRPRRRRNQL